MQVDESASDSTIDLGLGHTLEVRLAENPTTGYRWQTESDGSPTCVLTSDTYETVGSRLGTGGTRILVFRAARVGTGHIMLANRRAWEAAARTFTIEVRVAD